MVALKKAIEEEAEAGQGVGDGAGKSTYTLRPEDAVRTVHMLLFLITSLAHARFTSYKANAFFLWCKKVTLSACAFRLRHRHSSRVFTCGAGK